MLNILRVRHHSHNNYILPVYSRFFIYFTFIIKMTVCLFASSHFIITFYFFIMLLFSFYQHIFIIYLLFTFFTLSPSSHAYTVKSHQSKSGSEKKETTEWEKKIALRVSAHKDCKKWSFTKNLCWEVLINIAVLTNHNSFVILWLM